MDSRVEEITRVFPGLKYDVEFHITSPENADYNCIAWSFGKNDMWLWPDEDMDGVTAWPNNDTDTDIHTFIKAYESQGYKVCDSDEREEGFEKVALYALPDSDECTHASRQLPSGLWTSKLGSSFDICHSTPYTIQGRVYGVVVCILYRRIN